MPAIHDAHATMFGLARHGELYERWAGRLAGRLYTRVTADLLAAALPPGARILDAGTGTGLLPLPQGVHWRPGVHRANRDRTRNVCRSSPRQAVTCGP